jgi:hypothetical protein
MSQRINGAIWAFAAVLVLLVACTPRVAGAPAPAVLACYHDDGATHDGDNPGQAYPCQFDSVRQAGSPVGPYGTRYTRYQEGPCSPMPADVTCLDVSEWE